MTFGPRRLRRPPGPRMASRLSPTADNSGWHAGFTARVPHRGTALKAEGRRICSLVKITSQCPVRLDGIPRSDSIADAGAGVAWASARRFKSSGGSSCEFRFLHDPLRSKLADEGERYPLVGAERPERLGAGRTGRARRRAVRSRPHVLVRSPLTLRPAFCIIFSISKLANGVLRWSVRCRLRSQSFRSKL